MAPKAAAKPKAKAKAKAKGAKASAVKKAASSKALASKPSSKALASKASPKAKTKASAGTKKASAKAKTGSKKSAAKAKAASSPAAGKAEDLAPELDELVGSLSIMSLDDSDGALTVGNQQDALAGKSGAVKRLAEAVHAHKNKLKDLVLWFNNIGDLGAAELAPTLSKLTVLRTLNVDSNSIGDRGAQMLAGGLEAHPALEELSLCENNIGDTGLRFICQLYLPSGQKMVHCPRLSSLHASKNDFSDLGMLSVAQVCEKSPSLSVLHLGQCNEIGTGGLGLLSASLLQNVTLCELHISSSKFDKGAHEKFVNGASHCANLLSISVRVEKETASVYSELSSKSLTQIKWNTDDVYHDDEELVNDTIEENTMRLERLLAAARELDVEGLRLGLDEGASMLGAETGGERNSVIHLIARRAEDVGAVECLDLLRERSPKTFAVALLRRNGIGQTASDIVQAKEGLPEDMVSRLRLPGDTAAGRELKRKGSLKQVGKRGSMDDLQSKKDNGGGLSKSKSMFIISQPTKSPTRVPKKSATVGTLSPRGAAPKAKTGAKPKAKANAKAKAKANAKAKAKANAKAKAKK